MKPTFIQPCFIRKNTPELRRKLEKLGYDLLFSARYGYGEGLCVRYNFATSVQCEFDGIDCGTNEDLFLAVAALREDSDEYQWFTDGKNWLKCQYESIEDERQEARECHYYGATVYNCHKATVEELIEHFKKD